jgi:sigma-B regulation protein RsbU (phosphoserine phosphatase)
LIVGLFAKASYHSSVCSLRLGERLLLATDGVTEAENSEGGQFEESWLGAATHCRNIGEILDQVAKFHAPRPAQDDCTLVEILFKGQA